MRDPHQGSSADFLILGICLNFFNVFLTPNDQMWTFFLVDRGLEQQKNYDSVRSLRYGSIMIMADQDRGLRPFINEYL